MDSWEEKQQQRCWEEGEASCRRDSGAEAAIDVLHHFAIQMLLVLDGAI